MAVLFGHGSFLWMYCVVPFLLWGTVVNSYLLNAYEQAIGQWDLTLIRKERKELMDSILFPPIISSTATNVTRNVSTENNIKKNKLDCKLCLEKDGSFTLSLLTKNHQKDSLMDSPRTNMPLQGIWKLQPNPYCVTDRQYDELCLISNPRIKRAVHRHTSVSQTTAVIEMRCKIWGRYGTRSIRNIMRHGHGRSKGRITHGTILLIRSNNSNDDDEDEQFFLKSTKQYIPKWRRRIICGKFCGKANTAPSILQPNHDDHDDDEDVYDDLFENEETIDY